MYFYKELNNKEKLLVRVKDMSLKVGYILGALRSMNHLHLMDIVICNGKRYFLTQGVSDPHWNLSEVTSNGRLEHIHRDNFKKEISFHNFKNAIKFPYEFYIDHWHDIYLRRYVDKIRGLKQ